MSDQTIADIRAEVRAEAVAFAEQLRHAIEAAHAAGSAIDGYRLGMELAAMRMDVLAAIAILDHQAERDQRREEVAR